MFLQFIKLSEIGIQEADIKNIYYLREIEDLDEIASAMEVYVQRGKVVVIGGGYLGIELSASLKANNHEVTMIFPEPWLCKLMLNKKTLYNTIFCKV